MNDTPTDPLDAALPVEQRISHRLMIYAARRSPGMMNQYSIEDIVKEEMARGTKPSAEASATTTAEGQEPKEG